MSSSNLLTSLIFLVIYIFPVLCVVRLIVSIGDDNEWLPAPSSLSNSALEFLLQAETVCLSFGCVVSFVHGFFRSSPNYLSITNIRLDSRKLFSLSLVHLISKTLVRRLPSTKKMEVQFISLQFSSRQCPSSTALARPLILPSLSVLQLGFP